jgi:regulator of protease activity HflC (stomatin/prohibitin superfamily)
MADAGVYFYREGIGLLFLPRTSSKKNMIYAAIMVIVLLLAVASIRVAQEYERAVVFRLGRLNAVRGPGLYFLIPFIEQRRTVDMRTRTVDVESQETITTDSVTIKVNAVLWYKVVDPIKSIIDVADYRSAVYQVSLTSLRNIIGQHKLDEVLSERNKINDSLRTIVDHATDPWGIKIEMVEMKDVEIPEGMQRAMAREAEAIREKRARVIKAEAELEASEKLSAASRLIAENPSALELRRMQMISEIGAENNTTTIILMPSDFVTLARSVSQTLLTSQANGKTNPEPVH